MTAHDDLDIDDNEDFENGSADLEYNGETKPSLRELWNTNPLMKIAALALGGVVLIGVFMAFAGGGDEDVTQSRVGSAAEISVAPGQEEVDEVYRRALEEKNQQIADLAERIGGSALPTPIGVSRDSALGDVAPPLRPDDPLEEWRRTAEARAVTATDTQVDPIFEEQALAAQADLVPIVQPVRPQIQVQQNPEAAKALAAQMREIISAQQPLPSTVTSVTSVTTPYAELRRKKMEEEAQAQAFAQAQIQAQLQGGQAAPGAANAPGATPAAGKVMIPAGTISYAQLLTELNSDVQGPALAQVLSGPLAGGRAIGAFQMRDEYLVISFDRIVKDSVSYNIQGIALDPESTLTGMQTDISRHYFSRVILPAAATFVKGMAGAYAQTATRTTATGDIAFQDSDTPDTKEQIAAGIEEAAETIGQILENNAQRPVTVVVKKGTPMGILFMQPVMQGDNDAPATISQGVQ